MPKIVRFLGGLTVLAAVAGCFGPSEPEPPIFEFSTSRVFGVRRSPPEIQTGEGFVEVTGIFEVPHPLFTITGWLTQPDPRTLQLAVRGNPDGPASEVASLHLYRSRVSRLAKGNYELELIYVVNKGALRDSTVVLITTVAVR